MTKNSEIILKNGEKITLVLEKTDDDGSFKINAFNQCDAVLKIGYVTFNIKSSVCYLYRIEICDEKYSHLGLGTAMLQFMEFKAKDSRCRKVDGKFYPFGDMGKHAKDFYLKNGYQVYKDGYDTLIYKDLLRTFEK